jgi:hypothetical protein
MQSYYQRYISGERKEVWEELRQQGAAVRQPPLLAEAHAVCREVVERCYGNLRNLHSRLIDLGYRFQNPADALREPSPEEVALLDHVEATHGLLPLLARVWYERISSVDFSQDPQQLYGKVPGEPPGPVTGLGFNALAFLSLEKCLELRDQLAAENEDDDDSRAGELSHFLPTGGSASNCEPMGFALPNPAVDGVLYNEGFGDVYFMDALRGAFTWAGFPFWQRILKHPKAALPVRHAPEFARLLPILTSGLAPI